MSRHIESVHFVKTFKCLECEKEYKRKHDLGRHVKSAHRLKSYMCVECDQSQKRQSNAPCQIKALNNYLLTIVFHFSSINAIFIKGAFKNVLRYWAD